MVILPTFDFLTWAATKKPPLVVSRLDYESAKVCRTADELERTLTAEVSPHLGQAHVGVEAPKLEVPWVVASILRAYVPWDVMPHLRTAMAGWIQDKVCIVQRRVVECVCLVRKRVVEYLF
jgi:hypothetical protein